MAKSTVASRLTMGGKQSRAGSTKSQGANGHNPLYSLPTLYRGIYNRVADKLGCDPSYVSRVARGERRSDAVARALETEIRHTLALSSRRLAQPMPRNGGSARKSTPA
ncbi:MAG TPA: hypothetical protein VFI95_20145 [Terriglobales bacterium]|nr:hypothetical protein [Terriglobales bacterium]